MTKVFLDFSHRSRLDVGQHSTTLAMVVARRLGVFTFLRTLASEAQIVTQRNHNTTSSTHG